MTAIMLKDLVSQKKICSIPGHQAWKHGLQQSTESVFERLQSSVQLKWGFLRTAGACPSTRTPDPTSYVFKCKAQETQDVLELSLQRV